MAKPSDLPKEIQAAAIISATQVALAPICQEGSPSFNMLPSTEFIVSKAIDILKEYAKQQDVEY